MSTVEHGISNGAETPTETSKLGAKLGAAEVSTIALLSNGASAITQFDYSSMSPELASGAQEAAKCIRRSVLGHWFEVGRMLKEMKDRMKHGEYTPWIEGPCGMSIRNAERYMLAYEMLNAKPDIVSCLNDEELNLIAAPSLKMDVREAV